MHKAVILVLLTVGCWQNNYAMLPLTEAEYLTVGRGVMQYPERLGQCSAVLSSHPASPVYFNFTLDTLATALGFLVYNPQAQVADVSIKLQPAAQLLLGQTFAAPVQQACNVAFDIEAKNPDETTMPLVVLGTLRFILDEVRQQTLALLQ